MSKKLLKGIFLFTIISFAERGINYLVILALSIYLSPEELGKLSYVLTVQSYIYPVLLCYTNGAILLHYSVEEKSLGYFYNSSLINTLVFFVMVAVTVLAGLLFKMSILPVLIALLLISLLEAIRLNYLAYNQAFFNLRRYATIAIMFVVLNLLFTFLFLIKFDAKYEYRVYAMLISGALTFALILFYLAKERRFHVDKKFIKKILSYGAPLLPHAYGLLFIESLNRYFLEGYGKHELGLYSFAFTLAAPLGILNTAFMNAWMPHLYRLFKEDTLASKRKIVQIHFFYILFILLLGFSISLFAKNILELFSAKYAASSEYLKVVPFFFCVQAVYVAFSATLFYFKKNKYFIYLAVVNTIVSFSINYTLFSRYGASATAYCAILSFVIFTTVIVILSQRTYPLPWLKMVGTQNKT